mmetsp:Transcript_25893/g.31419  ORF Transcript_25893/g.31419 Transcript_25893/m.31419 type:complete len:100 (-) Transcript_25893:217-516(-)
MLLFREQWIMSSLVLTPALGAAYQWYGLMGKMSCVQKCEDLIAIHEVVLSKPSPADEDSKRLIHAFLWSTSVPILPTANFVTHIVFPCPKQNRHKIEQT